MTQRNPTYPSAAFLNDAAVWHARLNSLFQDEKLWAEFTDWLEADSDHRVAFDQVESLYADLDTIADKFIPFIESPAAMPIFGRTMPTKTRSTRFGWTAAAIITLLAATLLIIVLPKQDQSASSPTVYVTKVGETKKLALADGSIIELNTDSAVSVALVSSERHIWVNRGEALFRVAADAKRPFLVTVGDLQVRDVGTIFDALREPKQTTITVAEGRVSASRSGPDLRIDQAAAVELSAGDRLVQKDGSAATVRRVDPAMAASWINGFLVYENAPLSQIVDDLNRYFPRRIQLEDVGATPPRFSGILKIDNEDAVLDRLARLLPLAVDRTENGPVSLRFVPSEK